jgi:cyanate permease
MQNGFGNLGGVVAPALTGFIVDRTGSYQMAFVAVACMLVGGAACFQFIVGPVKQITWTSGRGSGHATAA